MAQTTEDKVRQLEKDVQKLKKSAATSDTPVIGIATLAAFVCFVWIMSEIPLPDTKDDFPRFWIGVGSAFGGMVIFGLAASFTEFALKAIVEVAVVSLGFVNVLAGAFIWSNIQWFEDVFLNPQQATADEATFLIFAGGALALFLFNVGAFLFLFPLAKTSGSNAL